MKGGKIVVHGDIWGDVGGGMSGGVIVLFGDATGKDSPGKRFVGGGMTGGEIYLEGNCRQTQSGKYFGVAEIGQGRIYHKGRLIAGG
jgi:formylmethanofuran dehydrogenase subunit C